jgi:hypothetical protein
MLVEMLRVLLFLLSLEIIMMLIAQKSSQRTSE